MHCRQGSEEESRKVECVFPSEKYLDGLVSQVPSDFQFGFKVTDEITVRKFPNLPRFGVRAGFCPPARWQTGRSPSPRTAGTAAGRTRGAAGVRDRHEKQKARRMTSKTFPGGFNHGLE